MSNYSAIIFPPIRTEVDPDPGSLSDPPPYNEIVLDDKDLPSYEAVTVTRTGASATTQHPKEATTTTTR